MDKFEVTITETLEKIITVEASDGIEACNKVRKLYHDGKIVLTADDFTERDFSVNGPLVKD